MLLTEPTDGYGVVSSAISGATKSIELTMYELSDTEVTQALGQAARRGVLVKVLLDRHFEQSANQAAYDYLEAHGVAVHWGPSDVTVHEKALCIDDAVCYVMTGNLTPQYYASTRDFVMVDRQSSDVAAVTATFAGDFAGSPPGPAPVGSDLVWSPGSEPDLAGLIDSARERLLVENEEMDSSEVVEALEQAAQRGVHVVVVMTHDSEWDQAFDQLTKAGVDVVTYAEDAALYIHAKVIVADSRAAFVGSENFSTASMDYNRELGLITGSPQVVAALTAQLQSDAAGSTRWQA
jgi:cardiolipin synthase A/B